MTISLCHFSILAQFGAQFIDICWMALKVSMTLLIIMPCVQITESDVLVIRYCDHSVSVCVSVHKKTYECEDGCQLNLVGMDKG